MLFIQFPLFAVLQSCSNRKKLLPTFNVTSQMIVVVVVVVGELEEVRRLH
jgi:hypothetical protein